MSFDKLDGRQWPSVFMHLLDLGGKEFYGINSLMLDGCKSPRWNLMEICIDILWITPMFCLGRCKLPKGLLYPNHSPCARHRMS